MPAPRSSGNQPCSTIPQCRTVEQGHVIEENGSYHPPKKTIFDISSGGYESGLNWK
jgi:hypothetical protein